MNAYSERRAPPYQDPATTHFGAAKKGQDLCRRPVKALGTWCSSYARRVHRDREPNRAAKIQTRHVEPWATRYSNPKGLPPTSLGGHDPEEGNQKNQDPKRHAPVSPQDPIHSPAQHTNHTTENGASGTTAPAYLFPRPTRQLRETPSEDTKSAGRGCKQRRGKQLPRHHITAPPRPRPQKNQHTERARALPTPENAAPR